MALSYTTTNQLTFVDSQYGSAANQTGIKSLVNQVVDRKYHKQVLKKSFFTVRGMVGEDGHMEGGVAQTAPGFPVIRKTDLNSASGDVIKMGLKRKLTADHKTGGKIGNAQLVDNEVSPDFYNLKVSVDEWRQGVRMFGGMNRQRNPYGASLEFMEEESLQDWQSEVLDTSLLYAQWAGYTPNLLRAHGHTNCPPAANPNTLFGNDTTLSTSRTIADLDGTSADNLKAVTFEIGATFCEQNDFDPVSVNGQNYWVALISPQGHLKLLRDSEYREAVRFATMGRGAADNSLLKWADAIYGNCIIFRYDKIRSILGGLNPAGTTVSSNEITEASYTGIGGGITAGQLHQTIFLGANALAHAEVNMTMTGRKEDDYGKIVGTGISMIFGARRTDWKSEAADATANQSSLVIVNHTA